MAKDISSAIKECEQELAKRVDGKYFILENFFKDRKMKEYEERAKRVRAGFEAGRGNSASAARAMKELSAFEADFVKWYEADEDLDDAQMFSTVVSFIREAKEKLKVYGAAMDALGAGGKEACMAKLAAAFGRLKQAAQKADALAHKTEVEMLTDATSTIMRYIDVEHEMRLAEMMAPSGTAGGAAERAVARMGGRHGDYMSIRSNAYHLKNPALQKAAAELLDASYEYEGALCAAYLFSEQGSG